MINIQSEEQAIALLNDQTESVSDREAAIYYLGRNPLADNLALLIKMLEDSNFGVRWVAAVALAQMGDAAMPTLLQALIDQHDSAWLREGTHHILHYSKSETVRDQSAELQKALHGPAAEVMTTKEAAAFLRKFQG